MYFKDKIDDIIAVLENGGLLLYPTDTIWGLGCDAQNVEAIEKIYALKNRPKDKPLTILVDSVEMLKKYIPKIHPRIETLHVYHVKPLTLIYENSNDLPEILLGKNRSAGIRIVKDEFCHILIREFGRPIVSTSANLSGEPFPESFGEISSVILSGVDYVAKHRQEEKQKQQPSVVARFDEKGELTFLRT
ncbi:MAG: L-threonylcarbamoyladenylate synthase [Bacteroidota bacterium]